MVDYTEKNFEQTIQQTLLEDGYHKRSPNDYDQAACLIPDDVIAFIHATQPVEWDKFKKMHGPDAKNRLLKRVSDQVRRRGTLEVLRKVVKCDGCRFYLAYFRPASGMNPELQKKYEGNIFSMVRQLRYSEKNENSLDIVLFLNGLPIFTVELKNPLTGQSVQDAIWQYRTDRIPREPLFQFGCCLAHFAVDPDLVYVTTHLQGMQTRFLPFNLGRNGGAGNPPRLDNFATAYLWEQIWARDSVLELIQHFIHIVEVDEKDARKPGKKKKPTKRLIFPRYHQLDVVRRLVAGARAKGPGQNYLIQHSAGSGKSNSIAWLAHRLSVLHTDYDQRVFDSIIIITDRRVLDRQLQRTVRQFQQVDGVVENIDTTSRQLKKALEDGKTIIVTTLQKFPVIVEDVQRLAGHHFALIIDEAHSSQTGESAAKLKTVLAQGNQSDDGDEQEEPVEDWEDQIVETMKKRGKLPNVSTFAFTATPKGKTLQLFGTPRGDDSYAPFSLYSMRQAIEEGFILDVLENYTAYHTYWRLLKTIKEDPRYEKDEATYLLKSFVDHHELTIRRKVEIMMGHFAGNVMGRIGGKAKAMIVTRSRLQAVRYRRAVDEYIQERGYPFKALVAFSGTVKDGGKDYTEANMNGFSDTRTAEKFKGDDYRLLIVANKFQTGFDQSLLHTMYVDKKLREVHAVQTLSRLNRVHPGKEETLVLDFANEADDIQKAFQPYYDRTILTEGTDPNVLYDLETRLEDYGFYTQNDVDAFAQAYFDPKGRQARLHSILNRVVDRFKESDNKDEKTGFRDDLGKYVQIYAFLSQVLPFADAGLEKLYQFGRFLRRKLPAQRKDLPVEIQQQIDIDSYRIQLAHKGKIALEQGQGKLAPVSAGGGYSAMPDELEALSAIIKELNEHFGTDFSDKDKVFIEQLEAKLSDDPALEASVRANPPDHARLTFDHVASDKLQDMIDSNFKFYKQVTDHPEFAKRLFDWLFERYLSQTKERVGQ